MIPFSKAFPDSMILEDSVVRMRAMSMDDLADFRALSKSSDLWTYFTKDLTIDDELDQWVKDAIIELTQEKRFPFTVIEKKSNLICGSTSFGNISFYDKRIEIGWTWVGNSFMKTGINTHAKFLLLQYAFDTLGFERVEFKTDNLNTRAKKALEKIGAKPEGVLRNHMQMFNNRRRDSIYYSIVRSEWPDVRKSLESR